MPGQSVQVHQVRGSPSSIWHKLARDKFRDSGTRETVGGAGANEVSGVLEEANYCRSEAPHIGIALHPHLSHGLKKLPSADGTMEVRE